MQNILITLLIKINHNPKKLFLIDSIGAFLTAILLFVILSYFEPEFGLPKQTLYCLFTLACTFAIYSFACYKNVNKNWNKYLQIISIANFLYCLLTLILIIIYRNRITKLGLIYFIIEVIIIGCLAYIEIKIAKKYQQEINNRT